MLPIRQKPTITYDYKDHIRVIPNALDTTQIYRLREYAKSEQSGLHRRGSKDFLTKASFNTCQVYSTDDEIYTILNPLWKEFVNLEFIEPYEIKEYLADDVFEYHTDAYFNLELNVDRKLNMIIQLSHEHEYEGGELLIGREFTCSKSIGTCIIFPASFYHKVNKIVSGVRYSLIGHGWGRYHI